MSAPLTKQVKAIGNQAIDFILPPLCPATGEMVDALGMVHPTYWQSLHFINHPICTICGNPFGFEAADLICADCIDNPRLYHMNRSALAYDDASRDLILRFKHGDQTHAVKAFLPWLRQAGDAMLSTADIITPVPLHRYRLIKRRYNQADLMGRELARYYPNCHYYPDALLRLKNTKSQGHKRAKDRKKNVAKAFIVNPLYTLEGKTIILIDDVYTTGATLNECAKMLYRHGAKEVNCLTLAKVIKS